MYKIGVQLHKNRGTNVSRKFSVSEALCSAITPSVQQKRAISPKQNDPFLSQQNTLS